MFRRRLTYKVLRTRAGMGVKGSIGSQSAHTVFLILALVALFSFGGAGVAAADVRGGRFSLRGSVASLTAHSILGRETVRISPIVLKGALPGVGRVRVVFTRQRFHPSMVGGNSNLPVLLQGTILSASGSAPAAGSIRAHTLELTTVARKARSARSSKRIFKVQLPVSEQAKSSIAARVASIPVGPKVLGCGSSAERGFSLDQDVVHHRDTTKEVKVITIATDADPEWVQRYGDNSHAVITSFLNTAEALYDAQFGIRFRLVAQHSYRSNSPYTSNDVGALLAQFVTNLDNATNFGFTRDTYRDEVKLNHLFTGKDLDGGIVGMAYIGVACSSPALSYGVTQYYGDLLTPLIFAHELGHNLGAYHDTSDKSGLMYPNVSGSGPDHFSSTSVSQISAHVSANSGCFTSEQVTTSELPVITSTEGIKNVPNVSEQAPAPPPEAQYSTILVEKRRVYRGNTPLVKLVGIVVGVGAIPVPGVKMELFVDDKPVASVKSRKGGRFSFLLRVRVPSSRRVAAWVRGTELGVESNRLTIKRSPSVRSERIIESISSRHQGSIIAIR